MECSRFLLQHGKGIRKSYLRQKVNMTYIFEKLYLGDLDDACNSVNLRDKKGISHILTVDCKPLVLEAKANFVHKYVHALDMDDFDLLSHFDDCIEFIEEGRKAGGVLVHCYAGQSRSATIATAYLMAQQNLTMLEALQLVKKMRPSAGPNPGFLRQLELFEAMGNRIIHGDSQYRQYRLQKLASHMLHSSRLSADPFHSDSNEAVYKCRKCRRSLFRESGVVTHSAGSGHSSFKKHSKMKTTAAVSHEPGTPCSESIFVEPVVWMQPMILHHEGKLNCPKCHAKIGSFRWAGEQCPCGQWVIPAFHLQKSKLDYCDSQLFLNRQQVICGAPLPTANSSGSNMIDNSTKATSANIEDSNSGNSGLSS